MLASLAGETPRMRSKPHDETMAEELSRHGLRATRQRVAALRALRRLKGHPSAAELHVRLRAEQPNLSHKTVYEILDNLVAVGLASRVMEGGEPTRFESRSEPHYHARCRVCGRLFDLPASADSQIRGRTPLPDGFRVETIHVTLRGVCQRCRDEV